MKIFGSIIIVVAVVATVVATYIGGVYNTVVQKSQSVDTQWAQVETQYQRRFDLIPNLANATKGFLKQEQKVFGDIAEARTHYANAKSGSSEKVVATNQMEGALARLLVVMENYPQLKSDQTVRDLMTELAGTENRINVSRERYNEGVRDYNTYVKVFPRNVVGLMFNFGNKEFFSSEEGSEKAPTVNLTE